MLNKKHLLVAGAGAALIGLLTLTQSASSKPDQGPYQLGGCWIGKGAGGDVWTSLQVPVEPQGKAVALRVTYVAYPAQMAGLLSAFGADGLSEFVGQGHLFNRDTSQWTLVGYAQLQGNPLQIRAILIGSGTFQFTDPNHGVLKYSVNVYPAAADADGDGMPDPGAVPAVTLPNIEDTAQRVPLL